MIKTTTQLGIRLQAITFQLQVVNERTVKDPLLNQIMEYGVAEKVLSSVTIFGVRGTEAHARLSITIDYEEHARRIRIDGDSIPSPSTCSRSRYSDGAPAFVQRSTDEGPEDCPVWREAIDWFTSLINQKDLKLVWTVRFCCRQDEMFQRFNLVTSRIIDCTAGAPSHAISHSFLPELTAMASFSRILYPS